MPPDQRPFLEVAVGILIDRSRGLVLLGQRPAGKPYAGWWEFPGGKLESGESVHEALAREMHEELGLSIGPSYPWVVREHAYEHARVRLHFRRVFDWHGDAVGREGQAFAWSPKDAITLEPLLPAALPLLPWLALPGQFDVRAFSARSDWTVLQSDALATCETRPSTDHLAVWCSSRQHLAQAGRLAADVVLIDAVRLEPGTSALELLETTPAPAYLPWQAPTASAADYSEELVVSGGLGIHDVWV